LTVLVISVRGVEVDEGGEGGREGRRGGPGWPVYIPQGVVKFAEPTSTK
jgi:hypothetical protein